MNQMIFLLLQAEPLEEGGTLAFMDSIGFLITIISVIAAAIVFIYQHIHMQTEMFTKCTEGIHSDNEIKKITSAILLRRYLQSWQYRRNTIKVIVALLRVMPNGNVQKTLADSFSHLKGARGEDVQKLNLHDVLIKPKSYINYEITENERYLRFRINMKRADFYKSNISESSIHSVNFDKAVFCKCLFYGTSFRNCTFVNADFREADLNQTRFINCDLEGALFAGAKRIAKASVVKVSKDTKISKPLIEYLDKEGMFCSALEKGLYDEDKTLKSVFISKLGLMDSYQQLLYDRIEEYLKKEYNLNIITLNREEYMNYGQLATIVDQMSLCSGAVIFANSYLYVSDGVEHRNHSKPDKIEIKDQSYTSPWIQIEAAFASSLKLPTLLITEDGVICNGILDDKIVLNDSLLYKLPYSGGLTEESKSIISDWYRTVERK